MNVKTIYEDPAFLVVEKPRGVLSEVADEDSLPALLEGAYGTVFPVHRLDRAVGGVMVYARTKTAAAALCAAVTAGALQKEYFAVVAGVPVPRAGEMRDYLFKDGRQNKSFVVPNPRRGAREAVLAYETLHTHSEGEKIYSLVKIRLQTGRSHQIRVQFATRGWPLVGDGKYGSREKAPFIALHAARLSFEHPVSGERIAFAAPPPTEFPWSLFPMPHFEIERKFLIRMPDERALAAVTGARRLRITQTYLDASKGLTWRVRRVDESGNISYIETRKQRHSDVRCTEDERALTREEYDVALGHADPARRPIEKVRWCLPFGAHTVEVDIYPFWQDRAIAEVELSDEGEPCPLPSYLHLVREVSDDKRYKNAKLAKEVPNDPL